MSLSCATPLGRILELQRMQRLVASQAGQPLAAQVRMRADMDTVPLATVEAARGRGILSTLVLLLRGAEESASHHPRSSWKQRKGRQTPPCACHRRWTWQQPDGQQQAQRSRQCRSAQR